MGPHYSEIRLHKWNDSINGGTVFPKSKRDVSWNQIRNLCHGHSGYRIRSHYIHCVACIHCLSQLIWSFLVSVLGNYLQIIRGPKWQDIIRFPLITTRTAAPFFPSGKFRVYPLFFPRGKCIIFLWDKFWFDPSTKLSFAVVRWRMDIHQVVDNPGTSMV